MAPRGWNPRARKRYTLADIQNRLRLKLAIDEARPFQLDCIDKAWNHYRDVLVNAGMGSGKTNCFLGMAVMEEESTVLIISPLKGLMHDQVRCRQRMNTNRRWRIHARNAVFQP